MQDTLFRTDQRQYLTLGVQVYIIPPFVEARHRLAQLGSSLCGLIAVSIRASGHLTQFLDGLLRWRHIRTSDSQTDNILALGIHLSHLLQFPTEVVFAH